MKYYFCKFIPPRENFLFTMSEDEKRWMKEHADYLNQLLDRGLITAHGPVIDGAGGFGLSLYQVQDDQDITALTSEDPIVKNGVGHYEHLPMLHLTTRG